MKEKRMCKEEKDTKVKKVKKPEEYELPPLLVLMGKENLMERPILDPANPNLRVHD